MSTVAAERFVDGVTGAAVRPERCTAKAPQPCMLRERGSALVPEAGQGGGVRHETEMDPHNADLFSSMFLELPGVLPALTKLKHFCDALLQT